MKIYIYFVFFLLLTVEAFSTPIPSESTPYMDPASGFWYNLTLGTTNYGGYPLTVEGVWPGYYKGVLVSVYVYTLVEDPGNGYSAFFDVKVYYAVPHDPDDPNFPPDFPPAIRSNNLGPSCPANF